MMKICTRCKTQREDSEFYWRKSRNTTYPECKFCHQDRMRERTRKIGKDIRSILGNCCVNCGYNRCPAALELHHLDPSIKEFGIGKARSRNMDKIKAEIAKCILVCSNCHREIHWGTTEV